MDLDRVRKILFLVFPTMLRLYAHSFHKKMVRTLTKLCLRGTVALRAKAHQKYAIAISAENRHQSTYGIIRQDTVQIHVLPVGYDVNFISPILESCSSYP